MTRNLRIKRGRYTIKNSAVTPTVTMGQYSFAAANSARGFFSKYDEIFNTADFDRVYILKGGPGTGKSSFMRRAGMHASEKGYEVEYFLCSSDPDSLDAVIARNEKISIVILDGTAPHQKDADIPGAIAEIVNLGQFWNAKKLTDRKSEIIKSIRAKSACFDSAYLSLAAAGKMQESLMLQTDSVFNEEKAKHSISIIFDRYAKRGDSAKISTRIKRAYSVKGEVKLPLPSPEVMLFSVCDIASLGKRYMELVRSEALSRSHELTVSYSPLDLCPDSILLPRYGIGFELSDIPRHSERIKNVNMKRFICADQYSLKRKDIRVCEKHRDALVQAALSCLYDAGRQHFTLEEIYAGAMDFVSLEKYQKEFLSKIF